MALYREQPKCPYCGEGINGIYENYSDVPFMMCPIGDSFIGWDYRGHDRVCKYHPLNNNKNKNKMTTRAKLVCQSVKEIDNGATANPVKTGEQIDFRTQYNQTDSKEDNGYSIYTPNANFSMAVTNSEIFGNFEVGKAYYFDITPCES